MRTAGTAAVIGRLLRRLSGLILLGMLLAGLPLVLAGLVGWPLPRQ